jgi:four helix bundle protein
MSDKNKDFTGLNCWIEARVLRQSVRKLSDTFPKEELYRLTDQIIRSSRSVTANLAEGYGRYHYLENIKFCTYSRGSLDETKDHLTVALDEEYMTLEQFEKYEAKITEVKQLINGYIRFLRNKKQGE